MTPMSLATRCPACSTVFRVVQDQLRVSEGWVRCGRCSEVFNAVDHMVDLPRPSTPAQASSFAPGQSAPHEAIDKASLAPTPTGPATSLPAASTGVLIESDHAHDLRMRAWNDPGPAERMSPEQRFDEDDDSTRVFTAFPPSGTVAADEASRRAPSVDEVDLELSPAVAAPITLSGTAAPGSTPPSAAEVAGEARAEATAPVDPARADELDLAADVAPSFLREAERAERWQQPSVRRALAAVLVAATLALCLQVAREYRDLIAARWIGTRPALELVCRWTGCRVEHPRLVDALVVDSSGLVRIDGTNSYRFSVVLRNRSALTLAMPAIDLTLTDTQGRMISRRTLSAAELGVGASSVAAAAELALQATLGISDRPVAGYTIEVFYP